MTELKWFSAHNRRIAQIKTASISAIVICDDLRVREVLLGLRHLAAVFCKDDTIDDQVLEGSTSLDSCGDDHEGIEPAAGLVETFSDEVSGEFLRKLLLIR